MQLSEIFEMGASLIEGNSDSATTGLNIDDISSALGNLLGDSSGNLDIGSLVSNFSTNGLSDIVTSWLDSGENQVISMDQISDLIPSEKIAEFASGLGLSEESAKSAIADVLPQIVDRATTGEDTILSSMLDQAGGTKDTFEMLGKMFR